LAITSTSYGLVPRTLIAASVASLALVPRSAGASRPTVAEIKAETRSAVAASRATVAAMRVVGPNRRYAVRIEVPDPAAYLKFRVNRVVAVVNRLTNRLWLFRSRTFAVVDRSGGVAFSMTQARTGSAETTRWYVRPDLADCARNISFDIEIDPDNAAPPCPVQPARRRKALEARGHR
jgi:hypothetical protein